MPTRIVFILCMIAALVSPAAPAEQWFSFYKTADEHPTEVFLDLSSIALKDGIRTARTKSVALLPWRDNTQPFNGAAYGFQRRSFDCHAGLVQFGGVVLHSAGGGIVGFLDVEQSWKPADDESTKKMLHLVCAVKKPHVSG